MPNKSDNPDIKPIEDLKAFVQSQRSQLASGSLNPIEYFMPEISNITRFAVGPTFWYITERRNYGFLHVGGNTESMIGLTNDEFRSISIENMLKLIYPQDRAYYMGYLKYFWDFILSLPEGERRNYKVSIHARTQNREGEYIPMLMQVIDWIQENGQVQYVLATVTDISLLIEKFRVGMTIYDIKNNTVKLFTSHDPEKEIPVNLNSPKITKRQSEILNLLAKGLSSKMIGKTLNISVNTVNNHRQHLLKVTNSANVSALLSFAFQNGIVLSSPTE